MIYLDNSMTTRPSEKSVSAMLPFLTEKWGTPSAPHQKGQQLYPALRESYESLYALLQASEQDTVIFTSSGAEAVNHAIFSVYTDIGVPRGKNQFVVAKTDEAPALMVLDKLEELGCVGKCIDVDSAGHVTAELLGDVITPRTALVSLSWGNGLTGVIQPVEEIANLCEERGILLHLDATHVLGKCYFTLEEIKADLISFNGDHLHAPQGTGGLYIKKGLRLSPFISGGMEQGGLRAGSLNVPGLVALGVAADQTKEACDLICTETARLRNRLEGQVSSALEGVTLFFQNQERLPHISCMGFSGVANEALLYLLNRKGVLASIGGGSFQQIGLILMASGVDELLANSAVSFSLSRETTEQEIDQASEIIIKTVKTLQKTSHAILS